MGSMWPWCQFDMWFQVRVNVQVRGEYRSIVYLKMEEKGRKRH
jgi:hypothetical protein